MYSAELPFRNPPHTRNFSGDVRRVGVEIEFASVSALDAAHQVQEEFGGTIRELSRHSYEINGTTLGDFACKLDSQYVQGDGGTANDGLLGGFRDSLRNIFGDIGSLVIPCEIVCPPIAYDALQRLEDLTNRLDRAGAAGTDESLFYAFGVQFNPEIADGHADYILSIVKAQVLLSDWLRSVMVVDATRQITAFATQFPLTYGTMIADPGYWPGMDRLIADYLTHNPTRNRELDLLPLFSWIDAGAVHRRVRDPRIKSRPTFHYRLPDAKIGRPDWSLTLEWNRWCVVERLAADRLRLAGLGEEFIANRERLSASDWALRASEWLVL